MPLKKRSQSSRKRKVSAGTQKTAPSSKKAAQAKTTTYANKPVFPIASIHEVLEQKFTHGIVKPEAAIFLTSVMEYLAVEMLELSINAARTRSGIQDPEVVRLTAADVQLAIQSDAELRHLLEKVSESSQS